MPTICCYMCKEEFQTWNNLLLHVKMPHEEEHERMNRSKLPVYSYTDSRQKESEGAENSRAMPLHCYMCKKDFKSWKTLLQHIKELHGEEHEKLSRLRMPIYCYVSKNVIKALVSPQEPIVDPEPHAEEALKDVNQVNTFSDGERATSAKDTARSSTDRRHRLHCYRCNEGFSEWADLLEHGKQPHHDQQTETRPIARGRVQTGDDSKSKARRLGKMCSYKTLACGDCGKDVGNMAHLMAHQVDARAAVRNVHHIRVIDQIGSLTCEVCSEKFTDHHDLEHHFVLNHAVIKLTEFQEERGKILKLFMESWKKNSPDLAQLCVENVFKIYQSGWRAAAYEEYRREIRSRSGREALVLGNELLTFHGTSLTCQLGKHPQKSKLCQCPDCCMCGILLQGFDITKARKSRWQRFGPGIYTTPISGKSDDYISSHKSQTRAVLVCKVIAGNPWKTKVNMEHLSSAPQGYDSVWGVPGEHLNYEEIVVYDSRAILPCYIVVYSTPPLQLASRLLRSSALTVTVMDGSRGGSDSTKTAAAMQDSGFRAVMDGNQDGTESTKTAATRDGGCRTVKDGSQEGDPKTTSVMQDGGNTENSAGTNEVSCGTQ